MEFVLPIMNLPSSGFLAQYGGGKGMAVSRTMLRFPVLVEKWIEEEARAPYFSLFFSFSSSRAIHIASYKLMLAELVRRLSAAERPMARTSDVHREMAVEPRLRGGSAMPGSPAVGFVFANLEAHVVCTLQVLDMKTRRCLLVRGSD